MKKREEDIIKELSFEKEGLVVSLQSSEAAANVSCWLSTGVLAIDLCIGKGIPAGRLTEVYGDFGTGKTLLAMHLIKEAQQRDFISVVIDTEAAFSTDMAKKIGVDLSRVIYVSPDSVEEVFEVIEKFLTIHKEKYSDTPAVIIWDSVAATPCKFEIENPVGTPEMGLRARLISQGLRKITSMVSKEKVVLFFVNQIRESMEAYGDKYFTPGGRAIKFHASVRLYLKAGAEVKEGGKVVGREGLVKVTKNKVFPPFKTAYFTIYFDKGIPKYSGLAKFLKDEGIIEEAGGWYKYKDLKFRATEIEKLIEKYPEVINVD